MTYQYECKKCGHEWEAEQKISEPALRECPSCHEQEAQRVICNSGAFVLNGRCWAKDGYS
jgi:putative FmdB family regulatory protein